MRSKRSATGTSGMTATDPETETGPGPIRGASRSLENQKPPSRRARIAPRYRTIFHHDASYSAKEAAILDEFLLKLAAIEWSVPKNQRHAARAALLSERAAKLRRFHETSHEYRMTVVQTTQHSLRPVPCNRFHRRRQKQQKSGGFSLRR